MILINAVPRRGSLLMGVARVVAIGLALGLLVVLLSGIGSGTPTRVHHSSALRVDLGATGLGRAMAEHDCTTTGFGDSATPRSALIRHHGRLRHVSFDRAWSVFTGSQPGELLAVCLSEVSVPERTVASGS